MVCIEKVKLFQKNLSIHHNFEKTLEAIRSENINLPPVPSVEDFDSNHFFSSGSGTVHYEKIECIELDERNGEEYVQSENIYGYDESIEKYQALEGSAYFTSHSLVHLNPKINDYIPSCFLTFYFYTRSKTLLEKNDCIKSADVSSVPNSNDLDDFSDNQFESAYKRDYAADRSHLIQSIILPKSLLFIDGPLIGGQMNQYSVNLNNTLLFSDIIPVFFVKNSSSNLVIDNISEYSSIYNSDMHWSYTFLKRGSKKEGFRTNFFRYTDAVNPEFSKVFCYLKPFKNRSPQRVEFHTKTFDKYESEINSILDAIYYLLLVHGDVNNPQVRPIAIAESFARQTLKILNINEMLNSTKLTPTMNEVRGFR